MPLKALQTCVSIVALTFEFPYKIRFLFDCSLGAQKNEYNPVKGAEKANAKSDAGLSRTEQAVIASSG